MMWRENMSKKKSDKKMNYPFSNEIKQLKDYARSFKNKGKL